MRGLAVEGSTIKRGFLFDTRSPTQIDVITGVRRGEGSAREILRRENPERGSRPLDGIVAKVRHPSTYVRDGSKGICSQVAMDFFRVMRRSLTSSIPCSINMRNG
jgi:hypothetical protein